MFLSFSEAQSTSPQTRIDLTDWFLQWDSDLQSLRGSELAIGVPLLINAPEYRVPCVLQLPTVLCSEGSAGTEGAPFSFVRALGLHYIRGVLAPNQCHLC